MVRYSRCVIEQLDRRVLLSGGSSGQVTIRQNTLFIVGSNLADTITVTAPSRQTIRISAFGEVLTISRSLVRRITASLGRGNDVYSAAAISLPQNINGQAGRDSIVTGSGDDTLLGEDANDTLRAGNGRDLIFGGEGDDRLFGQGGSDTIQGDAGNDFIRGGADYDVIRGLLGRDNFDPVERYTTEVFDYSPRLDVAI